MRTYETVRPTPAGYLAYVARRVRRVTDPDLMRGDGWVRCCICGELHVRPFDGLARDSSGKWDVCSGQCAREAGIEELEL